MKKVQIFGDGSALGNPGPGGYGAILRFGDIEKEISGGMKLTTNNQMELKAVIEALKQLKFPCEVDFTSDSNYVVKGINEWLSGWVKNNWKGSNKKDIKNVELWKEYYEVSQQHKINAIWVKGHAGHIENERCDKLARGQAEIYKALEE